MTGESTPRVQPGPLIGQFECKDHEMQLRVGLLALAVAAVGTIPVASAQAAACNQVTDRDGDASDVAGTNESLDIVSADLGSDATTVTAVIRVKTLLETSPTTPQTRNYYLLFSTNKPSARMFLNVTMYQGGVARYGWGTIGPVDPLGLLTLYDDGFGVVHQATGFLDVEKNEIHVSALVSDLSAKGGVAPGAKLSKLEAATFYQLGFFIFEADNALSAADYVAGSPSCVTPGK